MALDLEVNDLTGLIPIELGNLTNLERLNLSYNQLSGSIPGALGNLNNLQNLYLHNNQLTGTIPMELGNLTNLKILYLSNNQLEGSIPQELGNLTNLKELYISGNRLTGEIPATFVNLNLESNKSDLRYNALYTENDELRHLINEWQIDNDVLSWESTQTVAPTNLTVVMSTDDPAYPYPLLDSHRLYGEYRWL